MQQVFLVLLNAKIEIQNLGICTEEIKLVSKHRNNDMWIQYSKIKNIDKTVRVHK